MTDTKDLVGADRVGPQPSWAPPEGLGQRSLRQAIEHLGAGFLTANPSLVEALADNRLAVDTYWNELVGTLLQLLVVGIAEGRDLLVKATVGRDARRRYDQQCSMAALLQPPPVAESPQGGNLWRTRVTVLEVLAERHGVLFTRTEGPWGVGFLRGYMLGNADLRAAAHLLAPSDLAGWGAHELGGVREALLELAPRVDGESFTVRTLSAARRRDGGVYYTPTPVVEAMLNLALDPVIDRYSRPEGPGNLLQIQVTDPACGTGIFLVAAARRLATRYAALLADDPTPPSAAVRFALPVVMLDCIRGIDIDPVAVALARTALWLEVAASRSHPMSFMDRNLICGDALAGPDPWAAASEDNGGVGT